MNTKEGNKIIAKFMGLKTIKELQEITEGSEHLKDHYYLPRTEVVFWEVDMLPYHKSWDWLMPVIHKLWDTPACAGPKYEKLGVDDEHSITSGIKHHMQYGSIYQCWLGVVDLIKWEQND